MKKEIKDYLHLYLGSRCIMEADKFSGGKDYESIVDWSDIGYFHKVKHLILRPLSSMTEEECDQFGIYYSEGKYVRECFEADATYGSTFKVYSVASLSERLNEMRRSGIDCDNLIPDGLAINAETLK